MFYSRFGTYKHFIKWLTSYSLLKWISPNKMQFFTPLSPRKTVLSGKLQFTALPPFRYKHWHCWFFPRMLEWPFPNSKHHHFNKSTHFNAECHYGNNNITQGTECIKNPAIIIKIFSDYVINKKKKTPIRLEYSTVLCLFLWIMNVRISVLSI